MKIPIEPQTRLGHWWAMTLILGWFLNVSAATIEGVVHLPKTVSPPVTPARYQNTTPGQVGLPPPAGAVVYLEGRFPTANTNDAGSKVLMGQKQFQFTSGLLP